MTGKADNVKEERALLLLRYKETGDKGLRNRVIMAYMNIVKYAALSTRNMYIKLRRKLTTLSTRRLLPDERY